MLRRSRIRSRGSAIADRPEAGRCAAGSQRLSVVAVSRLTALGALFAVHLVLVAPASGALEVRLTVVPARPAALEPVTIRLQSYVPVLRANGSCCRLEPGGPRSYRFRVEAVSPAGKVVRVRARPTERNVWRGVFVFPTAGLWTVRVANYADGGYRAAFGSRPRIVVRVTDPDEIVPPTPPAQSSRTRASFGFANECSADVG